MKTIGIIGWLGPETTAEVYLELQVRFQNNGSEKRPRILISSVPIAFELEHATIVAADRVEEVKPLLIAEAKSLQVAWASFLIMPCNTHHVHIDAIRNAVDIPVLSIIEEVGKFIVSKKRKKVGILSSKATSKFGLYESIFEQLWVETVQENEFQAAMLWNVIHKLVQGSRNHKDRSLVQEIIADFAGQWVDSVILACTDLQLLLPDNPQASIHDSMEILVDAAEQFFLRISE